MAKLKSRIPLVIAVPVIAIGAFLVLSFAKLFIGTKNFNEISHQYNDADVMARAFADFPKSHDGHYPSFSSSSEVFSQLKPFLETASKPNEDGHQYTTIERLQITFKESVWNKALSGAKANAGYDAPVVWTFYLPAVLASNRFVVGYSDGKYTNKDKSQLNEIFLDPGKN